MTTKEYKSICSHCKGTGRKVKKRKIRKHNSYDLSFVKCVYCEGKGYNE